MTLDEAIEGLTSMTNRLAHISQSDERAALRLGIQALKRIRGYRDHTISMTLQPLLGETEE